MSERFSTDGKIWLCCVCGKRAKDQFGMVGRRSIGWDESCMLNSVLVDDDDDQSDKPRAPEEPGR